jgi:sulfur-oxidizing protein SoxA
LHRRYGGCNENIRAKAFAPQSEEYRNLEFFQTVMSSGLEFNGPGSRK